MPRTMPRRCPPWWKQTCQEHLTQATCRAKACRAHLQSSPPKHLTLPVHTVVLVPRYPPCLHAPPCPCAPAEHLTRPARVAMLGPHAKRKGEGAEPATLRLLPARSNHWATLALIPWENLAKWWRKLVTIARPFQKMGPADLQVRSSLPCLPCAVGFFVPLGKIHIGCSWWKSGAGDGGLTDRRVVMEAEIRQGVCSSSPAKLTGLDLDHDSGIFFQLSTKIRN